ncbi:MAG: MFS transporter [gamma proteobacterium symbiont of Bathyaustriella thionipta]|nr:MFS transporter [gamma proteobacterium symbiont of Bathyaustriella thionipta]MCU7951334.1 MFS transporter [gamma proteobacterium symbiont of Bathyaustriella thionipta]MCU7953017.1 MFS transporter [gamma proteobacterium symbiont of Bathyaustriella thionipta]MCU7957885.1 MFS transporter [gamma proteobacterium symbiont of Bathyaustriella thionipta]MCU7967746.1 MFS transporter [gamma proteobacterium symbiont of Bathyaustriella thionipta]
MQEHVNKSWLNSVRSFLQPQVITMLFLGFSAGIPLLLIFSSLSLWLVEAGIQRSTVTYFSWAALGYSFKFLWAPLIDRLPVPFLTRLLGRRRAWLLVAQGLVISAIVLMALIDPAQGEDYLILMAFAAILLGFSSATQDIVIDAYRIESADSDLQALMSSTYIAGYRIGMLASGAGALILASYFGSEKGDYSYTAWHWTYLCMALFMLIGVFTTLIIPEPVRNKATETKHTTRQYLQFLMLFIICIIVFVMTFVTLKSTAASAKLMLSSLSGSEPISSFIIETLRLMTSLIMVSVSAYVLSCLKLVDKELVWESYIAPVSDFFQRYGKVIALMLLIFIGFYRVSDIVLGVIANVFFQEIGFTKLQIATVVKTFGLIMTIAGGFLGGILAVRFGVMKILFVGALLTVITNLLFMLLASAGNDIVLLYLVISADNLSAGLASAAFVAFLSSLTNISFTAVQYAIFSSLMTLMPKLIGGYSGSIVESIGYSNFFLVASLMGIPVLFLLYFLNKHMHLKD